MSCGIHIPQSPHCPQLNGLFDQIRGGGNEGTPGIELPERRARFSEPERVSLDMLMERRLRD